MSGEGCNRKEASWAHYGGCGRTEESLASPPSSGHHPTRTFRKTQTRKDAR